MKLYKYLKKDYVKHWINDNEGAIIFSPLARFKEQESTIITSDYLEGALGAIDPSSPDFSWIDGGIDRAKDFNPLRFIPFNDVIPLNIIISSFSTECSEELKRRFSADVILEFDFDNKVQKYFSDTGQIIFGEVEYVNDLPFLPSYLRRKQYYRKRVCYQDEKEYRFVMQITKQLPHNDIFLPLRDDCFTPRMPFKFREKMLIINNSTKSPS